MYKLFLLVISLSLLSGCLAPKAFLEPKYRGLTYRDIKVPEHSISIQLTVRGETNGDLNERASTYWRRQVERVLSASRVFVISDSKLEATLTVTINNVANRGSAAGKGFMTGLTFGAVGTLVTDGYIMTVDYTANGAETFKRTYQHAIYTTIGNAKAPEGIAPVSLAEAPSLVAEDMLLHFLKELQQPGATEAERSAKAPESNPVPIRP